MLKLIVIATLLSAAVPVAAQDIPGPTMQQLHNRETRGTVVRSRLQSLTEQSQANQNGEDRVERANRLSVLVNEGRCREALAIARREHDPAMAVAIQNACAAPRQ